MRRTTEKAGGNPKQVEVSLTIRVCVFVVVLRATKPRIACMRKNLQKLWKSEKKATLKAIRTSGLGRLPLLMKITESTLLCLLVLPTWTVPLYFLCTPQLLTLDALLILSRSRVYPLTQLLIRLERLTFRLLV